MLNPPKKLCRECSKNPPHTWRKICIACITRISKEKAREAKVKQEEKLKNKKQLAKKKKAFSRWTLVKEADRVFSIYIRERDRGKACITCEARWEDNHQNWHFASRRHLNTRWMEKNANWQCPKCNLWGAGEQFKHWLAIDKLYGRWTAEQIMRLAQDTSKTTDEEILMHIRYYYW
jgi:hypothetical protein